MKSNIYLKTDLVFIFKIEKYCFSTIIKKYHNIRIIYKTKIKKRGKEREN